MLQQKIAAIEAKRASAKPLPTGSGPFTSSAHFRLQSPTIKPVARRWDHRLSRESLSQYVSELKVASRGGGPPSLRPRISLGTGRPATKYFPFTSVKIQASSADPETGVHTIQPMACTKGDPAYDLNIAMNYGFSAGAPQTLRFITEHVEMLHDPPYEDWACAVSCGSTSALEIAFRLFCDRGDWILLEENTYPGTIATAKLQGLQIIGVAVDDLGLCPSDLDHKLQNWNHTKGRKPFLLYTIPCGQNPTGTTQSVQRREAIYKIAEKHDLFILEDDPYFYLNLGKDSGDRFAPESHFDKPDEYLAHLPPSYLSLDVSGRVMRMDSVSKILSPGLRFGWVTAPAQIIDKFVFHSEAAVLAPSGASQLMIYKLLNETWGHSGFIAWLAYLSSEYRRRRDVLVGACNVYLPKDICKWTVPESGMFLWIQIISPHQDPDVIEEEIYNTSLKYGALVSKGSWFAAATEPKSCACFRMSFATALDDDMRRAMELFANAVLEVTGNNLELVSRSETLDV